MSLEKKIQMSWNSQTKSRREEKKSLRSCLAIFVCLITLKQQKIGDENHLKNSDEVPGGIKKINLPTEPEGRTSTGSYCDWWHTGTEPACCQDSIFKKTQSV